MTEARIERVEPDPWGASEYLERARGFLADGSNTELLDESRQVLLHTAVVTSCDAVLLSAGRRVVGSEGGHLLRLREAQKILGRVAHARLFQELDDIRVSRNDVSYALGAVEAGEADDSTAAVGALLGLVARCLEGMLPDWSGQG